MNIALTCVLPNKLFDTDANDRPPCGPHPSVTGRSQRYAKKKESWWQQKMICKIG